MSFTDVKIKIPGPGYVNDVMHRKHAQRIWEDLKKVSELSLVVWRKKVDFHFLAEARLVALWQVPHVFGGWGADGKASIEGLCLSSYVEEPLNSKVIKSYVPELRSRECFSCFEIPMFYVYIYYEHFMYVSHISVSWVWHRSILIHAFPKGISANSLVQNLNQLVHFLTTMTNFGVKKFIHLWN